MFKKTIFQNTVNKHRTQDTEHRHRTQNTEHKHMLKTVLGGAQNVLSLMQFFWNIL